MNRNGLAHLFLTNENPTGHNVTARKKKESQFK